MMTPLARQIAERVRREGPIGVDQYMEACLGDPVHGYYRTRAAIGAAGDFVTAPEISQVFGELIGLWCAVVWQRMGEPRSLRLVELGPGRGTLMRDVLRAARAVPAFRSALKVHLVEASGALAAEQRAALASEDVPIRWSDRLDGAGTGATVVIANEFLDTLPVTQLVHRDGGWRVRRVGLDDTGRLVFVEGEPVPEARAPPALRPGDGDVFETRAPTFAHWAARLAALGPPLAALLIDYGYEGPATGDTLQAVRAHRWEDPLAAPGEADLTAQVDFAALAAELVRRGLACDGPVRLARFLGALGIAERASRLMAANPAKAIEIETGVARLMAPVGMGTRFLALGARSPDVLPLPALEAVDIGAPAP